MNRETARRMGEEAGINWLTVMDSGDQLAAFATAVEQAQRRALEQVLRSMLTPFDKDGKMTVGAGNRNAVIQEALAALAGMGEPT